MARMKKCFLFLFGLLAVLFPLQAEIKLDEDFSNLYDRQYFLRIGLVQDATAVRVVPHSHFFIHDQSGAVLFEGEPDTPLRFTGKDIDKVKTLYYYRLAGGLEETKAREMAGEARKNTGLEVEARRDPQIDYAPLPDGTLPEFSPWVVLAGPFSSRSEAQNNTRSVGAHYRGAPIIMALERNSTTRIQAQNGEGKVVAEGEGYLGVRPQSLGDRMRAGYIRSTSKSWASKKDWMDSDFYVGMMEIWANKRGRTTLVNRVFLEDYLYGVVPVETGGGVSFEMMKVQAVISRSVAIAKLRSRLFSTWHFDLDDTQRSQVYKGCRVETPETNAAVDATWGQVCVHKDKVINAVYSQCCGGITADAQDAWRYPTPYLKSRLDGPENLEKPDVGRYENAEKWVTSRPHVYCNPDYYDLPAHSRHAFRWERTYSAKTLAHIIGKRYYSVDSVHNIRIVDRRPSGLIAGVQVDCHPRGTISLRYESEIRNALNLPSAFFTLDREFDSRKRLQKVTLKGAGRGHGVGLCQMGAIAMSQEGYDYLQILRHYYDHIEIYKIYH